MAEDKVTVKIDGDSSSFGKEADKAQSKLTGLLSSGMALKAGLVGVFVGIGAAIKGVVGGALESAAALEDVRTQYNVLTGSIQSADAALKQLQAFSAATPFQFDEVANAGRILLSFGFSVDSLTERLQRIGDVAAATNSDFKEISLIYGQVAAAGKLTGERLLQLQERGINVGPALAKSMGVAETAVRELVSKGKVDFATFEKAFNSLSDKGGIAFGGLGEKSQTLNGKISTTTDNFVILSQNIGNFFLPVAKKTVDAIGNIANAINELFRDTSAQDAASALVDAIQVKEENIKFLEKEILSTKEGSVAYRAYAGDIERAKKELKSLNEELDSIAKAQLNDVSKTRAAAEDKAKVAAEEARIAKKTKAETNEALKQLDLDKDLSTEEALTAAIERENELQQQRKDKAFQDKIEELEAEGNHQEALALIAEEGSRRKIEAYSKELSEKKKKQAEELAQQQTFFSTAVTLANSQNKTLAAIGKAAALADIAIKTPKAVADSFAFGAKIGGPPVGFALGAVAAAAMAAQGAQVAGLKGYADGGVIGGLQGARTGSDDTMATVKQGEMVLNAQQQESLFNAIQSGNVGNGDGINVTITVNDQRFADAFEAQIVQRRKLGISRI